MIRKSVFLACAPPQAFRLFTERISDWWPEDRRHTRDPRSRLTLSETGGFWECATDGRQVQLGRVRSWEPPDRLTLDFFVGTDAAHPTDLEVLFQVEEGGTRVTINHGAGPDSQEAWSGRAALFERSWDAVLQALAGVATH